LQLYNRERSGNCYKARLMLALLDVEYEKVAVNRVATGAIFCRPISKG